MLIYFIQSFKRPVKTVHSLSYYSPAQINEGNLHSNSGFFSFYFSLVLWSVVISICLFATLILHLPEDGITVPRFFAFIWFILLMFVSQFVFCMFTAANTSIFGLTTGTD